MIRLLRQGAVAHVQLARSNKLNALNVEMIQSLIENARTISSDKSVKGVVLTGEGRCFSAGIDLATLANPSNLSTLFSRSPPLASPRANLVQTMALCWREIPVPVICALKGEVFGAGLQLALGADLRFAARDAKLSLMEAKHGIIPDVGISETTKALVRPDVLMMLAWSAETVSADDALRYGLVTKVVDGDADAAVLEYATRLAEHANVDALRAFKRLVMSTVLAPSETSLQLEEDLQRGILASPVFKAKVAAAMAALKNKT